MHQPEFIDGHIIDVLYFEKGPLVEEFVEKNRKSWLKICSPFRI
jgi:hypothetical protein